MTPEELKTIFKNNPALATKNPGIMDKLNEMPKENKYHNIITEIDGIKFDSQSEANRYCELKILKAAGLIKSFECQVPYRVANKVKYVVDFKVWQHDGRFWVEDVKGCETSTWKIKAKLFRQEYPEIELRIIKV